MDILKGYLDLIRLIIPVASNIASICVTSGILYNFYTPPFSIHCLPDTLQIPLSEIYIKAVLLNGVRYDISCNPGEPLYKLSVVA